jgi:hypothetical protein
VVDTEFVMLVAEQADERAALRLVVLRDGHWRDRSALRRLEDAIARNLGCLGLTPTERARSGLRAPTSWSRFLPPPARLRQSVIDCEVVR